MSHLLVNIKNMEKGFTIFKNTHKKGEKEPDFNLMMKVGEDFVNVGGGWSRKSKTGTNFISCLLSKPYLDRKGYHLVADETNQPPLQPSQEPTAEEEFIAM